jgi:glycosyltransferase involved in cell wall biosynthesis
MHILYFIPRYDATLMGNRIHADVIHAWRAHGITAEVLSLDAAAPHVISETHDSILAHRLPVSAGLPLKAANRALGALTHYPYLAGAVRHYQRFIRERRYDMVHIETAFPLGAVALLAQGRTGPPLAVTLPGADIMAEPEFDYGYGRFAAVRALLPLVFRRAAVLRADSPQIKTLAVRLGAAPEKIAAIPYNITADSFPPAGLPLGALRARSRAAVVARHGLDPARPIVVSLNRLHPFKGIVTLVEAVPHAQQAGTQPQVLIIGPSRTTPRFGDYGAFMQRRAAELGVADTVWFTGGIPHEQTFEYLAAADAVVVPSVAESFSRVVVEAAAAGTPPVVTRTTGVSDYVAEAGCGLVVPPRDPAALGDALARLLGDRALWRAFAERCPPFAEQFRTEKIADDLLRLYAAHIPGFASHGNARTV